MDMSVFFSPEVLRNRYTLYAQMRQNQPILHLADYRLWLLFKFENVRNALSDYATFSSDFTGVQQRAQQAAANGMEAQIARAEGSSLITTDPPMHRKLRELVTRAFTPKAVADLEPRIETLTRELLDKVLERGDGTMDVIRDLAYPLPVIVIAEMLGIPSEDRDQFKRWSDNIVASADTFFLDAKANKELAQRRSQQGWSGWELREYLKKIIRVRRAHPQDDLISGLIAAELDGERLTEDDLLSFCTLLLIAGNITTTNLIGNATLTFLENPGELARLRADMNLLTSAIEESLRYTSPVQSMFRLVAQDTVMDGHEMRKGDRVLAWIGSANRDEDKFPDSERFDITRNPNPHISFGFGIHYCLGAPLARLESRVVLNALLNRITDIERTNSDPLPLVEGILLNGITSLPVRFKANQTVHA